MTKEIIRKEYCNSRGVLIGKKVKKSKYTKEKLAQIWHDIEDINCKCGRERKLISFSKGFKSTCASRECPYWKEDTYTKIEKTKIKRGTLASNPEIIQKSKNTKLEKYGDENYNNSDKNLKTREKNGTLNSSKEIQEKRKKTKLEKYGNETYVNVTKMNETKKKRGTLPSSPSVIEKSRATKIKNNSFRSSKKVQEKTKKTKLERYGDGKFNNSYRNFENIEDFNKEKIEKLFIEDGLFLFDEFVEYFKISRSYAFRKIKEFGIKTPKKFFKHKKEYEISKLTEDSILNTRTIIPPLEIDVYSEKHKLAIEYNGIIWHSYGKSMYPQFNNLDEEDPYYHLKKTEMCEEKGITLFHIFENEWLDPIKKEIWISKIKEAQGLNKEIDTSKCIIKHIDSSTANKFVNKYHLEGCTDSEIKIGLFLKEELISVVLLNGVNSGYFEITRHCSKNGLSENNLDIFLNYIESTYKVLILKISLNRRWHFKKIAGFVERKTSPDCYYVDLSKGTVESQDFKDSRKIWDSGRIILEKEYK